MTPAIARDVLGLGADGLGLLMTAAGVGSLTGTLLVARLNSLPNRGRMVLIGMAFFAVLIMVYGLSSTYWLSLVAIAFVGLGYGTAATLNDTLIQLNVDEFYRGRVMAAYSTIWGLSPAGGLLAGFMANIIGLQWAVAVNGMLVLAYVVYLWIWTPMKSID
jgi:MFS family permease